MKQKLSFDEQIKHLKNKGVKFEIVTEEEALLFLQQNTYYFKLKAFTKNFMKNEGGQYCNLDFYHLEFLSRLDEKIRKIIFQITSTIEHYIRVNVNYYFTLKTDEDGYSILKEFLNNNESVFESIKNRKSPYTDFFKDKYFPNEFAIWHFLEASTFGELIQFIKFCKEVKNEYVLEQLEYNKFKSYLYVVKILRNVSSHNNCYIHNIANYDNSFKNNQDIKANLKKYDYFGLSKNRVDRSLKIQCIHDLLILLVAFKVLCKNSTKTEQILEDIIKLIEYIKSNLQYFSKNNKLYSSLENLLTILEKSC